VRSSRRPRRPLPQRRPVGGVNAHLGGVNLARKPASGGRRRRGRADGRADASLKRPCRLPEARRATRHGARTCMLEAGESQWLEKRPGAGERARARATALRRWQAPVASTEGWRPRCCGPPAAAWLASSRAGGHWLWPRTTRPPAGIRWRSPRRRRASSATSMTRSWLEAVTTALLRYAHRAVADGVGAAHPLTPFPCRALVGVSSGRHRRRTWRGRSAGCWSWSAGP